MENDRIRQQAVTDWTMEQTAKDFEAADQSMLERAREHYDGDWDTEMGFLY